MIDLGSPASSETLEDIFERQDGVASVVQAVDAAPADDRSGAVVAAAAIDAAAATSSSSPACPRHGGGQYVASIAAGERVVVSHAGGRPLRPRAAESCAPEWAKDGRFIEVAAPLAQHIRMAGVRGHRCGLWSPGDVEERDGIPVTSPLRLVIDMSSRLGVDGTGKLVDQLLRRKLLEMRGLRERGDARPAPGRSVRVLRLVVAARSDDFDAGESTLESRIRRVIRARGSPSRPASTGSATVRSRYASTSPTRT